MPQLKREGYSYTNISPGYSQLLIHTTAYGIKGTLSTGQARYSGACINVLMT